VICPCCSEASKPTTPCDRFATCGGPQRKRSTVWTFISWPCDKSGVFRRVRVVVSLRRTDQAPARKRSDSLALATPGATLGDTTQFSPELHGLCHRGAATKAASHVECLREPGPSRHARIRLGPLVAVFGRLCEAVKHFRIRRNGPEGPCLAGGWTPRPRRVRPTSYDGFPVPARA
jgi:hypothetical protein